MSPFLIHDYPKWAEVTVRSLRAASYAFAAYTGLAAILYTPASLKPETFWLVGSMVLFGSICLVAAIFKRYVIEWISLFFLVGGMSLYVSAIWILALTYSKANAGASFMTILVCLMLIRVVDLTVFWNRNVRAAKIQARLNR